MQAGCGPVRPDALTHRGATENVRSHIRSIAHEAGDFIQEIRHGAPSQYSGDWYRWTTSYLPGPPKRLNNDQIGSCRVHRQHE